MILISVKGNSFERVIVPDKFILTHCMGHHEISRFNVSSIDDSRN